MYRVIKHNSRAALVAIHGEPNVLIEGLLHTEVLQTEDFDKARREGMNWARDNGLLTTTHTYSWAEGTPAGKVWVLRSQNSWTDVQIIRTEGTE